MNTDDQARAVVCVRDCFYTLRVSELIPVRTGVRETRMVERLFHVRNLSQDADVAIKEAAEWAAMNDLLFNQSAESIKADMLTIHRRSVEERAEATRKEEEAEQACRMAVEQYRALQSSNTEAECAGGFVVRGQPHAKAEEMRDILASGATVAQVVGRYYPPEKVIDLAAPRPNDLPYLDWIATAYLRGAFAEQAVMTIRAKAVIAKLGEHPLPAPEPGMVLGEPGERVVFAARIVQTMHMESAYDPRGKTMVKMVSEPLGALVVHWNTGKSYGVAGDLVSLKATVKKVDEYHGQTQTIVQRVTPL